MRQTYLQKLVRNVAFLQQFSFRLKRHKTFLHNLRGEITFKCEDCVHPATKIIKREWIAESWGANKETQEILWNPLLVYFTRQTYLQKLMRHVAFLQHCTLSLKWHKTFFYRERKHLNVKIVANLCITWYVSVHNSAKYGRSFLQFRPLESSHALTSHVVLGGGPRVVL